MNLAELTAELATELRRPDMANQIRGWVRQVVIQCHSATQFQRDLVEEIVAIPSPTPVMKITQPDRLKHLVSISPCDAYGTLLQVANPMGGYMITSPTDIYSQSGKQLMDIAYIAGPTITIRSSSVPSHLFLQYYQTPDVREDTTQTWIMEQFPELVKSGVRARYYQATSNQQAAAESQLFTQDLMDLVSNFGGVN